MVDACAERRNLVARDARALHEILNIGRREPTVPRMANKIDWYYHRKG